MSHTHTPLPYRPVSPPPCTIINVTIAHAFHPQGGNYKNKLLRGLPLGVINTRLAIPPGAPPPPRPLASSPIFLSQLISSLAHSLLTFSPHPELIFALTLALTPDAHSHPQPHTHPSRSPLTITLTLTQARHQTLVRDLLPAKHLSVTRCILSGGQPELHLHFDTGLMP